MFGSDDSGEFEHRYPVFGQLGKTAPPKQKSALNPEVPVFCWLQLLSWCASLGVSFLAHNAWQALKWSKQELHSVIPHQELTSERSLTFLIKSIKMKSGDAFPRIDRGYWFNVARKRGKNSLTIDLDPSVFGIIRLGRNSGANANAVVNSINA